MTTAFASIVGAVVAALQAAPAVAPQVYRVRLRPIQQGASLACVVRPLAAQVDQSAGNPAPSIWATQVAVECYARATPGQTADEAVDALLEAAAARVLTDPQLAAMGSLIPAGVSYDFDADGEQLACAVITFQVQHATAYGSLTSL